MEHPVMSNAKAVVMVMSNAEVVVMVMISVSLGERGGFPVPLY